MIRPIGLSDTGALPGPGTVGAREPGRSACSRWGASARGEVANSWRTERWAVAPQTTTATRQAIPRSAIELKRFIPRYVAPWYDQGVKVDKLSVSFDPDLGDAVRAAAKRSGRGLSGWLAEAAGARLRAEALAEFLDGWEAEHGELTAEELARATAELGLPVPPRSESA